MEPGQTSATGGGKGEPGQGTSVGSGGTGNPTWPAVSDATASLFTWFDTNTDGSIAVAEIIGVLDPKGHHGDHLNAVVRRVVELIDTNHNGELTETEVSDAMSSLDSNNDGSLSPADLVPELAQQGLAPLLAVMLQGGPLPGDGNGELQPPEPPVPPEPPEPPEPPWPPEPRVPPEPPVRPEPPKPPEPPEPPAGPKATTVVQVVDVLLARFDGSVDGTVNDAITLLELLAVLDPKGHRQKIAEALSDLANAVDGIDGTSADREMSKAELIAAVAMLDTDSNRALDHHDHVPGPPAEETAVDLIGILLPQLRQFDVGVLEPLV